MRFKYAAKYFESPVQALELITAIDESGLTAATLNDVALSKYFVTTI
jgi:hypothetical protein